MLLLFKGSCAPRVCVARHSPTHRWNSPSSLFGSASLTRGTQLLSGCPLCVGGCQEDGVCTGKAGKSEGTNLKVCSDVRMAVAGLQGVARAWSDAIRHHMRTRGNVQEADPDGCFLAHIRMLSLIMRTRLAHCALADGETPLLFCQLSIA